MHVRFRTVSFLFRAISTTTYAFLIVFLYVAFYVMALALLDMATRMT